MSGRIIMQRQVPVLACQTLINAGMTPLLARLFASRGIRVPGELDTGIKGMLAPDSMRGLDDAVALLTRVLNQSRSICIVADYDCDGATACAIAIRGLRALGARVDYLVPNRFEHGYGLQPSIVELCLQHPRLGRPDLLMTVDNGIASIEGVAAAKAAGMDVLITDHHLAGARRPAADAIINPNQQGCGFPSKALAGCGVVFYLLIALRRHLRQDSTEALPELKEFARVLKLDPLMDLLALGTVADLVPLDQNNRILVQQGLTRLRRGQMQPGLRALLQVAGRDYRRLQASDLGFALGPRINAAGRLDDMSLGIECLIGDDEQACQDMALKLDQINRERRGIEAGARDAALAQLGDITAGVMSKNQHEPGHVAFDAGWHEGVIGLVAGKLKDHLQTPCIVFAPATASSDQGQALRLKGSGRSIPGVHLRDCLDWVAKQEPDLMLSFGGHAMAAGLSLMAQDLPRFRELFTQSLLKIAPRESFQTTLEHDGSLDWSRVNLSLSREIDDIVWGQNFPPPLLHGEFRVLKQRIVGERHLSLLLQVNPASPPVKGILFGHTQALPGSLRCLYRLNENQYQGVSELQVMVEHLIGEDGRELPRVVATP